MSWSLYCGWQVPLISLWNPFFSLTNSVRSYVDRCIVDDHFLLLLCCILSFLRRTVYVYVLIVVLWMTSSSYFLVASFLFFEEQSTFMCSSLYCGWPIPPFFLRHPFISSKNSLLLCVDHCIVDDQFLLFPCGVLSFLRRTVYVYVLIVVLCMTSSSYFLVASILFFEQLSTFMCWSLYYEWPVPLISLWNPIFSSKNCLRLYVVRCIVNDQFLLFPCVIFSFLRRTVYVYVLIVVLWMTSSSYFLVESFLFFDEQCTFICWSLYCGWPLPLTSLLHPFFSSKNSLRLCVDVVLWMTSSSYFLAASFLFFEEQSTFICWSLYCGWPFPLISLWNPFFSSKNCLRLCVDRCIVNDQFLLFPFGILFFLRRTVYVYVLSVVLWMTSSTYFLAASFLFFEEQSTFMCWSLYCVWPVPLISLWHPFFSSNNCLRLCVDRCIMNDQFLLFPCGILSFLLRTVYVYVLTLYCGWPVPLISLRRPFFSLKNSLRLYVDRCIVDDHFLLFPCGILSFLRRTVYVYVLIVVLWMTSSSYFLVASFLFF